MSESREDVTKLPKWAQWRIQKAERDLADARKEADAFAGTVETAIAIDPDAASMRTGKYPRFLPDRVEIEFRLELGSIEVALRDGRLRIRGNYGNAEMVVRPEVSNGLEIFLVREAGDV